MTSTIDGDSVTTEQADITNETLVQVETDAAVSGNTADTWVSPSWGTENKDERNEFASDQFTPDNTGWYWIAVQARSEGNVSDQDGLQARLQNVTDGTTVYLSPINSVSGTVGFDTFGYIVGLFNLAASDVYEYQVKNRDSGFDIDDAGGVWSIRSAYR